MRASRLLQTLSILVVSSTSFAESALTSPDLTNLVGPQTSEIRVTHDAVNARYYVNGSFYSLNGVRRAHAARVYANGVVDMNWRLPSSDYVAGLALAPNGDVFVSQGGEITRYKNGRVAEPLLNVITERTEGYSERSVGSLFTGADGRL
jgi:hypothetical protein